MHLQAIFNTVLNDWRKIICLKSKVSVERILVCYVCLAAIPMMSYICYHNNYDIILMFE